MQIAHVLVSLERKWSGRMRMRRVGKCKVYPHIVVV